MIFARTDDRPQSRPGLSHVPKSLRRPSQSQAHLAVGGARESAVASPSLHSQSGAGSCVKPSRPDGSATAPTKRTKLSSSTARPATPPLSSNNKSNVGAQLIPNVLNDKTSTADTTQVQANGAAMLIKSAASAAYVEAVPTHPHDNGSLDGPWRICERRLLRSTSVLFPLLICGV